MQTEADFIRFVLSAEKRKIEEAMLRHLAESQNARKQALDSLEVWLEETCRAELLGWFADNKEEVLRGLREAADPFRLPARFNRPLNPGRWRKIRR